MSTTIMNAITNLDLTDLDEIDTLITALKERKKALRTEKSAITKAEKEAEKARAREAKKAEKEAEKAEKAAAKATMKTLETLQGATLKSVKRETEGPPKPKNANYQNFCKWSKGPDAPTDEEVTAAGGRRAWLKQAWSELSKEAQYAPDAPWNCIA